jgi:hypothetical protein
MWPSKKNNKRSTLIKSTVNHTNKTNIETDYKNIDKKETDKKTGNNKIDYKKITKKQTIICSTIK